MLCCIVERRGERNDDLDAMYCAYHVVRQFLCTSIVPVQDYQVILSIGPKGKDKGPTATVRWKDAGHPIIIHYGSGEQCGHQIWVVETLLLTTLVVISEPHNLFGERAYTMFRLLFQEIGICTCS
jgi:hypothetical protein